MKIAFYIRVSTLEQAESGYSISEQKDKLTDYCRVKDWQVAKIYSDPGFSGASLDRPAMQQLITDCELGVFDAVLVYKLDRLSRSQKDTLYLIEDVFNANNVHFMSLSENFDTSTPFGKAAIGLISIFAQLEREQIKERMQMGKLGRAKAGKIAAWSTVPFGYIKANDTYEVNPLQANIVKQIYADYLSGKSITKIYQDLNKDGHIGKPVPWSYRTVRQILDHAVYTGRVAFKGHLYDGMHPAIISRQDWEEVQRQLKIRQLEAAKKTNTPRPFQSRYMLSGLLKCKYCGATMVINKSHTKNGPVWRYTCPTHQPRRYKRSATRYRIPPVDCKMTYKYRHELEPLVLAEIKKVSLDPDVVIKANQEQSATPIVDKQAIKAQLAKIKRQQDKLVDLYLLSDELDVDKLHERAEKLKAQANALRAQLSPKANADAQRIKSFRKHALAAAKIDTLDYERQVAIVKALIDHIDVDNEGIDIYWQL